MREGTPTAPSTSSSDIHSEHCTPLRRFPKGFIHSPPGPLFSDPPPLHHHHLLLANSKFAPPLGLSTLARSQLYTKMIAGRGRQRIRPPRRVSIVSLSTSLSPSPWTALISPHHVLHIYPGISDASELIRPRTLERKKG